MTDFKRLNHIDSLQSTFETIYAKDGDAIFRFILVRVSNRDTALDITQEAFIRLWQALNDEKDIENIRAFLFKITERLIIDWYRKKKNVSLDMLMEKKDGDGQSFEIPDKYDLEAALSNAEGSLLVDKLNDLPDGFRTPLYLRYVEDLSPKEIGSILGTTENAISVRINRGLKELKKRLENNSNK